MSGIGTGYDLYASTYSPDGRVFQVEYAAKAVEQSGTAVALRCKDGVVFGVEKVIVSKMLVAGSNSRLFSVGLHHGVAIAGLMADCRQLVYRARAEASNYKSLYGTPIETATLMQRVAGFVHVYTLAGYLRPFGSSVIVGGYDKRDGYGLYMVEPSGISWGYQAVSIGKARSAARTEIDRLKLSELTCREAVVEVAKIIHKVHDEIKDKEFELELSWCCEASGNKHQRVPKDIFEEADKAGREYANEDFDDSE